MKILFPLVLIWFLLGECLQGQFHFDHLETDVGMNSVRATWRDHRGFLWIGNQGLGLMRYDGYDMKRYQYDHENAASISGNFINCIFEDSQGSLWVGTRTGLNRYDWETDSFVRYQGVEGDPNSLGDDRISEILEGLDQKLWMLSLTGLQSYDRQTGKFTRFADGNRNEANFTSMAEDGQGSLWIVGSGNYISRFDPGTGAFETFELFSAYPNAIKKVYVDSSGDIWIGARDVGLFQFDPNTSTVKLFGADPSGGGMSDLNIRDILEYSNGQLLVAVDQGGLNIFNKATERFQYQRVQDESGNGLTSDGLISFHKDREGIVWVGTSRSGIDFYNPQAGRFKTYRNRMDRPNTSLASDTVGCVFEDDQGRVWIGTDGGGISILDPSTDRIRNLKSDPENANSIGSNTVRQIDQSSDGRIWVSTWNGGVDALVEIDGRFDIDLIVSERLSHLDSVSIWDIEIDRKNRLWVTTAGGIVHLYDEDLNLIADFEEELRGQATFHSPIVTEMPLGDVFVVTEAGIYRFDEETLQIDRIIEIDRPTVVAFEPRRDRYYVGTADDGVSVFDVGGELVDRFGTKEGLPDDYVRSIEILSDAEVWIGTNDGLCRYLPHEGASSIFTMADGLQGNMYFFNASCRTRDGRFYFGGTKGLSSFRPEQISPDEFLPIVSINRIALFGKPIDYKAPESPISFHPQALSELNLDWRQNSLSFGFSAVSMTYPMQNQYAYKLDGFDKEWVLVDATQRLATYTNIDPGEYVFRVKASNHDGIWNEEGTSIRISISPPFWQRGWFYVLCFFVVIVVVYQYILYRERRLRADRILLAQRVDDRTKVINKQNESLSEKTDKLAEQRDELAAQRDELQIHRDNLEEMVENRTRELVAAKEQAEESDRLKSQFLSNLSHEIRTPLNAIIGLTSFMDDDDLDSETRQDYVNVIGENSDSLLQLIEDILDFSLIASNQMKISPVEFSLNTFMDGVFSSHSLRPTPEGIDLRIENKIHEKTIELFADRTRIKQVLDNLMTNALKFTKSGFVELGVYRESNTLKFYVSDSGHGIAPSDIDVIFERFVKLEEDQLAARRGVGLGLAICKELADLMDGALTVQSEYGVGSTFTLSIPIILMSENPTYIGEVAPAGNLISEPELKSKKVLIIEDEKANHIYLREALKRLGIESEWASNGPDGIEALKRNNYFDLVLLDIKMPGMDGFEVLRAIRENGSNINVIAQTAYAMKRDEAKIRRAGFDGYLAKPIELPILEKEIKRFL